MPYTEISKSDKLKNTEIGEDAVVLTYKKYNALNQCVKLNIPSLCYKALNSRSNYSYITQGMTRLVLSNSLFVLFSLSVAIVHSSDGVRTEMSQPGALALMEQINLLVLYAVLFLYQPNPHRVLNRTATNTTPQEVLELLTPPQHNKHNVQIVITGPSDVS